MPGDKIPRDADVQKINSSLNEGLDSCRSVVANFRALLNRGANDNGEEGDAEEDAEPGSD